MTTTSTIPARTAMVATLAAICLAVPACGSEQGTTPTRQDGRPAQHAAADDVAAQVELRKSVPHHEAGRRQHSAADAVEKWVEQAKSRGTR